MIRSRLALVVPLLVLASSAACASGDDASPSDSSVVADPTTETVDEDDSAVFAPIGDGDDDATDPGSDAAPGGTGDVDDPAPSTPSSTSDPSISDPSTSDTTPPTGSTPTASESSSSGSATSGSTTRSTEPATAPQDPAATVAPPPPPTVATGDGVASPGAPADGETVIGAMLDLTQDRVTVGSSVEGRPIVAERFGTAGGRRVLVTGVIHGNEDAGVAVVDELRRRARAGGLPADVELWLVESMNPDGQAAQVRQNANQVDLNRNFPHEWGPIGRPGDGQYAGTGPASEPETRAMVAFIAQLRPDIAIWYHQDANLIIPSSGRQGRIRARYAELTGLPLADCCDGGGVYTGIAATWARVELADQEAVPFIVELPGGELSAAQVDRHTDAVLTIAAEG